MTACDVHELVWVESEKYTGFECARCLTMIETASGRCLRCQKPLDDLPHRWGVACSGVTHVQYP